MKKEGWIAGSSIIIILILIFFAFSSTGSVRDGYPQDCSTNFDCPPRIEPHCGPNGTVCNYTTYYQCVNVSQGHSECVPIACKNVCNQTCEFGCRLGGCWTGPEINKSDLIIYNVTNYTIGEESFLAFFVKNIGNAQSSETYTRVVVEDMMDEFVLYTWPLYPGETRELQTISYMQPIGAIYNIDATVDYENNVDESNEENNDFHWRIYMPHPW